MTDDEKHGWNHAQCNACWFEVWGISRDPVRLLKPEVETCCYCGQRTMSGIYIREKPGSIKIPHCVDLTSEPLMVLPDPTRAVDVPLLSEREGGPTC